MDTVRQYSVHKDFGCLAVTENTPILGGVLSGAANETGTCQKTQDPYRSG